MITSGVDAHKQVHAAAALDERGGEIGHWRKWEECQATAAVVPASSDPTIALAA